MGSGDTVYSEEPIKSVLCGLKLEAPCTLQVEGEMKLKQVMVNESLFKKQLDSL